MSATPVLVICALKGYIRLIDRSRDRALRRLLPRPESHIVGTGPQEVNAAW